MGGWISSVFSRHESASFPYNSENRDGKNGIDDPEGASSKSEITSIPSPFARIDLVKTAFVRVCQPDKETKKSILMEKRFFTKWYRILLMWARSFSILISFLIK